MPRKKEEPLELEPCPKGTGRWGTFDNEGRFVPDIKLPVQRFNTKKATAALEFVRLGQGEEEIAKALGVSLLSLSRWRREHEEFAAEWKLALEERAERLLETSYEKDVKAAYDDEKISDVKLKAARASLAQAHVKASLPEREQKATGGGGVTFNISIDRGLKKKAEEYVWETAAEET